MSTSRIRTSSPAPAAGTSSRGVSLRPPSSGVALVDAARLGTSGPASPLPHLARLQQAFGRHDLRGVSAHLDAAAAQGARSMGAVAFTAGEHVAFARAPSLHTAAHEAAHVVQQRQGIHLAGGVGRRGDSYERLADRVAEQVVRGESVEALLGAPGAARQAGGPLQVQRQADDEMPPTARTGTVPDSAHPSQMPTRPAPPTPRVPSNPPVTTVRRPPPSFPPSWRPTVRAPVPYPPIVRPTPIPPGPVTIPTGTNPPAPSAPSSPAPPTPSPRVPMGPPSSAPIRPPWTIPPGGPGRMPVPPLPPSSHGIPGELPPVPDSVPSSPVRPPPSAPVSRPPSPIPPGPTTEITGGGGPAPKPPARPVQVPVVRPPPPSGPPSWAPSSGLPPSWRPTPIPAGPATSPTGGLPGPAPLRLPPSSVPPSAPLASPPGAAPLAAPKPAAAPASPSAAKPPPSPPGFSWWKYVPAVGTALGAQQVVDGMVGAARATDPVDVVDHSANAAAGGLGVGAGLAPFLAPAAAASWQKAALAAGVFALSFRLTNKAIKFFQDKPGTRKEYLPDGTVRTSRELSEEEAALRLHNMKMLRGWAADERMNKAPWERALDDVLNLF